MTSEGERQRRTLVLLKALGVPHWRVNVSGVRGRKARNVGMADLYVAPRGGPCFWVEFKGEDEVQSAAQAAFQRAVEAAGGHYVLARGPDDVRPYLALAR